MNVVLQEKINNDENIVFSSLMIKPRFSWPTFILFIVILAVFIGSTTLAINQSLSMSVAIFLNTIASYIAYSITHEASHGLISENKFLNNWIGRISILFLTPCPFFKTYQFLHMTHHRYTNNPDKDPDFFCGTGPKWTLPFRWFVMDAAYVWAYFNKGFYPNRPKGEKIEFWLSTMFASIALTTIVAMGYFIPLLLLYLIPARIALFVLAITFDYLPHYPHDTLLEDNQFRATNNRTGLEWLLTPLLLGQNYHLTHHLYPNAPFYRYRKIWESRKNYHESCNPAVVKYYQLKADDTP